MSVGRVSVGRAEAEEARVEGEVRVSGSCSYDVSFLLRGEIPVWREVPAAATPLALVVPRARRRAADRSASTGSGSGVVVAARIGPEVNPWREVGEQRRQDWLEYTAAMAREPQGDS